MPYLRSDGIRFSVLPDQVPPWTRTGPLRHYVQQRESRTNQVGTAQGTSCPTPASNTRTLSRRAEAWITLSSTSRRLPASSVWKARTWADSCARTSRGSSSGARRYANGWVSEEDCCVVRAGSARSSIPKPSVNSKKVIFQLLKWLLNTVCSRSVPGLSERTRAGTVRQVRERSYIARLHGVIWWSHATVCHHDRERESHRTPLRCERLLVEIIHPKRREFPELIEQHEAASKKVRFAFGSPLFTPYLVVGKTYWSICSYRLKIYRTLLFSFHCMKFHFFINICLSQKMIWGIYKNATLVFAFTKNPTI